MNQGSRPVQRVLIVDDEPSVIATYRKGLGTPVNTERAAALAALETSLFDQDQAVSERAVEFDLVACSQGAEAIDAVQRACQQEQPFAVIFLDITMPPGIDGIETATRIRALDNNVNIVLVTGNRLASPTSLIARIPPADRLFFFQKPFHAVELRQLGLALCGKWQAEITLKAAYADLEARVVERTQALIDSKASLANAQRLARIGNWDWDLATDHVHSSDELYRLLGVTPGAIPARLESILLITHPDDCAPVKAAVLETLKTGHSTTITFRIQIADGTERILYQQIEAMRDKQGTIVRLSGTMQDITERQRAEEKISHLAYFDNLTDLPNRQFFRMRADEALALAKRDGRTLALLFIDLDNFKRTNDTLGHTIGDYLLKAVAERLRNAVRGSDQLTRHSGQQLGRFGGDEFIALLTNIDPTAVSAVAKRLIQKLAQPLELESHTVSLTASIGISIFPNDGDDVDTLLKHADIAMYYAKRSGKNTCQFFDTSMNEAALKRLSLEKELRGALEQGEFSLHYQPQLDLVTGAIVGVEALLRWRNPRLGQVSPVDFIPLAEETGLIVTIGAWVLSTACAQAAAWLAQGLPPLRIAVNLSPCQFAQPDLVQQITDILAQTGFDARYLELEITESLLMQDVEQAIETMTALKEMGVMLAIDDFGTGYSSLSYLQRFPIDRLKIDRAFVSAITSDTGSASIALAVIAMAHSLELGVVAEGVETSEQQMWLAKNTCDEIQGYLISRPLPLQELAQLLQEHYTVDKEVGNAAGSIGAYV